MRALTLTCAVLIGLLYAGCGSSSGTAKSPSLPSIDALRQEAVALAAQLPPRIDTEALQKERLPGASECLYARSAKLSQSDQTSISWACDGDNARNENLIITITAATTARADALAVAKRRDPTYGKNPNARFHCSRVDVRTLCVAASPSNLIVDSGGSTLRAALRRS